LTPQVAIIGSAAPRLPNTSCLAWPGQSAETRVIKLDLAGVAVSAGAACSSGKVGASAVLVFVADPFAIAGFGKLRSSKRMKHQSSECGLVSAAVKWNQCPLSYLLHYPS
jgi:cysteine sulfinate desulfinase/cysteine desulfurase-like protein